MVDDVNVVGIDPGISGAYAIHKSNTDVVIWDLPTIKKGKTGNKREIDFRNLYLTLNTLSLYSSKTIVFLERVSAMPRQGVTSMFSMGHTFGGIKALVAALGFELRLVTPQTWKKHFKLSRDKEESRALAIQLYPSLADQLKRKKDSDRAEALLIMRYGMETLK